MKVCDHIFFFGCHIHEGGNLPFLEVNLESCIDIFTSLGLLISCTDFFCIVTDTLVEGLKICKYEFEINDFDITFCIDGAIYMMDILILKISDDLEDCIDIADMREKLVSESFSFARSLDESCDINKLDGCRDHFSAIDDDSDLLEAVICDIDYPSIGFDGTKWKIGSFSCIGLGKCVKESRFTDIWETDDTDLHDGKIIF